MSKRRVDPKKAKSIALERIDKLMELSVYEVVSGNDVLARRYVQLARRIAMRTQTSIPKTIKYCKQCLIPLVAGTTCTVRLRNHKVSMRCARCDRVRRISYIKEQRDD